VPFLTISTHEATGPLSNEIYFELNEVFVNKDTRFQRKNIVDMFFIFSEYFIFRFENLDAKREHIYFFMWLWNMIAHYKLKEEIQGILKQKFDIEYLEQRKRK
jgi:hypothetical protein